MTIESQPLPQDTLALYFHEISQYPLLNKEREVELAQIIEAGNAAQELINLGEADAMYKTEVELAHAARQEFIQANLRLVVSIAKKQTTDHLSLSDLIQVGNIGLMHAVEKFDWKKGFKFSTYATRWIKQHIGRVIAEDEPGIHLPSNVGIALNSAVRYASRNDTDLSPQDQALADLVRPVSLNRPAGTEGDKELIDFCTDKALPVEDYVIDTLASAATNEALARLSPRQHAAVVLRYGLEGDPQSLESVGQALGVSRKIAKVLINESLNALRSDSELVAQI